jgi:hypothetical protein
MLAPLLLALTVSAPPAPSADAALERQRTEIAREVLRVAGQVQHDVERGDVAALVARVPPEGLRCAGERVPRARVEHDLRTEGSWLHGVFFGGPGAPAPAGQPGSLRELFKQAKEIAVVVAFREDAHNPAGMPCIDYKAKDTLTPGAPICFEKRDGRWWFAESLYPC